MNFHDQIECQWWNGRKKGDFDHGNGPWLCTVTGDGVQNQEVIVTGDDCQQRKWWIPVVVAWRRRWDAKLEEGSVADWLMSTKEEEGIQLMLHGDGDGMQNRRASRAVGKRLMVSRKVMSGHSDGEAVQMIVSKKWWRWFMLLCTAATYKSRKKGREGCCFCNCYRQKENLLTTVATGKNNWLENKMSR